MESLIDERLERYALEHTNAPPELLERLEQETCDVMVSHQMLTGRTE